MRAKLVYQSFSLLLFLGTVRAGTHVNISIGQQATTNPADVNYINGEAPAELRTGPFKSDFGFREDGSNFGGAKYEKNSNNNFEYSQGSAARLTAGNEFGGRQSLASSRQQSAISARLREQNRQNQEFERYIQNYHSGPTVETVFETATPSSSSQRQKSLSSSTTSTSTSSVSSSSSNGGQSQRLVAIGARPAQVHSFERQVSLPTSLPTATLLPPTDDRLHQSNQQSSSSSSSSSSFSPSSSSSGGFDQSSFDSSFNKPSFGYDDSDVQNQFPPTLDESQVNFGNSFYGGNEQSSHFGGSTPAPGYLPSYPRPVVTKTIQIAQPALKAKKYEIRHPAVQKEFYDIEERVVIKPAGTIVVELERPVAKIPKGETVLPLGHPHPAVASAYNTNGAAIVQTMGSDVVGNSGNNGNNNNQYSPSPVYNPNQNSKSASAAETQYPLHPSSIGSTTIASAVTTTPSYDSSSKDEFVEANLNKQFNANADAQYVTTTERNYVDEKQSNDGFYVTTTESNRNYGTQYYNRDETDRRYPSQVVGHIEVKNNGAPGVSTAYAGNKQYNSFSVGSQPSYAAVSSQYQPASYNDNNNNNNQFKGEFLSGEFYNHQQGPKPARLQESPVMRERTMHVIKHEHNIHLPPSQHNIYLGVKSEQKAQLKSGPRYNEEAAQVLELKPFLKHHTGSVVVYAQPKLRPATTSTSTSYSGRYIQQPQQQFQQLRQQQPERQVYAVNSVKYSAPYTNMRYYSEQSPRFVYGDRPNYREKSNLVAESESSSTSSNSANDDYQSDAPIKPAVAKQHAHIQIQIPNHSQEIAKPIVVTSTISPIVHNIDEERKSNYRKTTTSDVERFNVPDDYQNNGQNEYNLAQNANFEVVPADYERNPTQNGEFGKYREFNSPQKSLRIIESSNVGESASTSTSASSSLQPGSVDVNLKSTSGHVATPGSRVIAATPAPTDAASASESFHKRRIVVNHPFQTVREVVEHEPITNYHHVQVNEPASPQLYHHTAPYYQQDTHGALRQVETVPLLYHHQSSQTHGNLQYAPIVPFVHGVTVGYHHHG